MPDSPAWDWERFFFFQAEDGIRDKLVTGVQTCVFFQEEDGIRDKLVTGVQTCALPICVAAPGEEAEVVIPHPAPAPHAVEEQDRPRARGGPRRQIGRASCRERV